MEIEYLNQQSLGELVAAQHGDLVATLYVPTMPSSAPPQITERQIRFKNLVRRAAEQLEAKDPGSQLAAEILAYEQKLHSDTEFWNNQTHGLLICVAPGMIRIFHLPYDTEEYVAVGDEFFLVPVLSILHDAPHYYVLTVVQQAPKLLEGSLYGLHDTKLRLPHDVATARHIDENNQKSENQVSARGSSMGTSWFNGRGGAHNPQENDRMQFFRIIDTMVIAYIRDRSPLILAGIDAEIAEYRGISKYPAIVDRTISGSHSYARPEELQTEANRIIEEAIVKPAHQAAIKDYEHMQGANPGRAASDKASITQATEQGRVDKLLVRMTRTTTDVSRDLLTAVKRITFPEPELSETVNRLAIKAWQMSGTIIGLAADEIPHGAPMLARLRY